MTLSFEFAPQAVVNIWVRSRGALVVKPRHTFRICSLSGLNASTLSVRVLCVLYLEECWRVTLCVGGGGGSPTSCTTHLAKHYLTEQSVAVILRLLHTALPSISLSNKVNASHNDSDTGKAEIESSPIFPVAPTAQLRHSQRIDCAGECYQLKFSNSGV